MEQDTALESTKVKEETPVKDVREGGIAATNGNKDAGPARQNETNGATNQKGEIQRQASAIGLMTGYQGKYNWDDSNNGKSKRASMIPPPRAIMDYTWCNG
jgi:hypothetical protein